jgi:hypothetical protein
MVPELDAYFITSHHDDMDSVLAMYGPADFGQVRAIAHGFTTMPGMIAVICSAVAGGLVAIVVLLATHDPLVAGAAGLIGFIGCFVAGVAIAMRAVDRFVSSVESKFPAAGARRPRL